MHSIASHLVPTPRDRAIGALSLELCCSAGPLISALLETMLAALTPARVRFHYEIQFTITQSQIRRGGRLPTSCLLAIVGVALLISVVPCRAMVSGEFTREIHRQIETERNSCGRGQMSHNWRNPESRKPSSHSKRLSYSL